MTEALSSNLDQCLNDIAVQMSYKTKALEHVWLVHCDILHKGLETVVSVLFTNTPMSWSNNEREIFNTARGFLAFEKVLLSQGWEPELTS